MTEAHGISAWGFSPGSVVKNFSDDAALGICVTNTDSDDGPSVSVYSDGAQVVGVLVFDPEGNAIAGWGLVPASEVGV